MRPFNLLDALEFLWRHGRRIAAWAIGLALAAYLITFLIPPTYQSAAVILPPEDDELSAALSISRRSGGGIGALSRLGGSYFTQADVALATLRSRRVHESIVKEFDLATVYRVKTSEDAIRELGSNSAVRISSDGTISVVARDRDPVRAAQLANAFLRNLDELNRNFRASRARRTRLFLEQRVTETDSLLRSAENQLAAYQKQKGTFVVSLDTRVAGDAAGALMAKKTQTEIELAIARSYASPNSDELRRLEAVYRELNRQVGSLPTMAVGAASLMRFVAIQQQVMGVLTTQLEEARIREVMDTPTIQVLDEAVPAEHRTWPRRSLLAVVGALLGLGVGVLDSTGRLRLLPRKT